MLCGKLSWLLAAWLLVNFRADVKQSLRKNRLKTFCAIRLTDKQMKKWTDGHWRLHCLIGGSNNITLTRTTTVTVVIVVVVYVIIIIIVVITVVINFSKYVIHNIKNNSRHEMGYLLIHWPNYAHTSLSPVSS